MRLKQTFEDFEFIIVNNGSTDRSGEIADQYAAEDARIRVIHRERGNIGSGRNTGLNAAQGEYIAFIDDDDTCAPDFLNSSITSQSKTTPTWRFAEPQTKRLTKRRS